MTRAGRQRHAPPDPVLVWIALYVVCSVPRPAPSKPRGGNSRSSRRSGCRAISILQNRRKLLRERTQGERAPIDPTCRKPVGDIRARSALSNQRTHNYAVFQFPGDYWIMTESADQLDPATGPQRISQDMASIFAADSLPRVEAKTGGRTVAPIVMRGRRARFSSSLWLLVLSGGMVVVIAATFAVMQRTSQPSPTGSRHQEIALLRPDTRLPTTRDQTVLIAPVTPIFPPAPKVAAKRDAFLQKRDGKAVHWNKAPRRDALAGSPGDGRACSHESRSGCDRRRLYRADARLRIAYQKAIRARVERDVLVRSQQRWTASRRLSRAEPGWVADDYTRLAAQLDLARTRRQTSER